MFQDPFLKFVDFQLRSQQGRQQERFLLFDLRREDWRKLGIPPGTMVKKDRMKVREVSAGNFRDWEERLITAFDQKYHSPELWEGRIGRILNYCFQGFTQMQIAGFEGVSQPRINEILKKYFRGGYKNNQKA